MAATLELRTLGTLALSGGRPDQNPDPVLRQPKRLGLLLYLILQERGNLIYRDRLLSVFWPHREEDQARAALRQALRFLGVALGSEVVTRVGRDRVGANLGRFRCDALRFESLLDQARIEEAMTLYRGDFLQGFPVADETPAFQEWVHARRADYQSRAADAAWTLAEGAEARGQLASAAAWGKRAVEVGPYNEPQVQRLMRLLHRVGDRTRALQAYRGLETWMRHELGAEPSRSSWELAREIRALPEATYFGGRRVSVDRRAARDRRTGAARYAGSERRAGSRRRGARRQQEERRGRM